MHACLRPALAVALSACALAVANGAEWLSPRADAQRTGWQPDERHLTPKTVKGVHLLWKKRLGPEALSSPLLLGPLITHRGIKELVVVTSAAGTVSAVDADLGTAFWSRDLPVAAGQTRCQPPYPVAPTVLSSVVASVRLPRSDNDEDEFSDASRPVWTVAADGSIHALRVSTGEDIAAPGKFNVRVPRFLVGFGNRLYAGGSDSCDQIPARLEAIYANGPTSTGNQALSAASHFIGIALGVQRTVYLNQERPPDLAVAADPDTLHTDETLRRPMDAAGGVTPNEFPTSNITTFLWQGREVTALVSAGGQLILWTHHQDEAAKSTITVFGTAAGEKPVENGPALGGLTTWVEASGQRWLCLVASDGSARRLRAFRVIEKTECLI